MTRHTFSVNDINEGREVTFKYGTQTLESICIMHRYNVM